MTENLPGRRYCGRCGRDLLFPCGHCGFGNALEDCFCGGCGKGLDTEREFPPCDKQETIPRVDRDRKARVQKGFSKGQLEELLGVKGEGQEKKDTKEDPKKAISQDEIDKLLKGGS
jgi:hypothetical protein